MSCVRFDAGNLKILRTMIWLGLIILLTSARTSYSFNADLDHVWAAYRDAFAKPPYDDDDASKERLTYFRGKAEMVSSHNIWAELGKHTYWLGLNNFSDMSDEELDRFRKCFLLSDVVPFYQQTFTEPSREINYRKFGRMTPLTQQFICGCCFAISALRALVGQWAKYKHKLQVQSIQNAVDCSIPHGCSGRNPRDVHWYVIKNGDIDTNQSYPYIYARCMFNISTVGATTSAYSIVRQDNDTILKDAVYQVCPILVILNATVMLLNKYGVFDPEDCSSDPPDHIFLLIGYGIDKELNKPYWTLKNSWRTDWYENGYMRIVRNENRDNCGIAQQPSYHVI